MKVQTGKILKRILIPVMVLVMILCSTSELSQAAKSKKWPKGPSKSSITAESAIVMELNTGTILYEKNIHDKHYPASITKILTTLLCLENSDLSETVTFSSKAVNSIEYGSSNISIVANEQIRMEDCLYGIMLMSANEACNGVAEHIGGSIEGFVDMMNEKAKSLGCKDTHFANPNGLFLEDHYTSAYDMGLIATAAMKNSMFRKITGTKTYTMPKTNLKDERHLYNKHNMLYPITYPRYGYEYCIGGKTGYTDRARWTLVTFAKKDDLELVCVVMKTAGPPKVEPNEYTDTISLMNYAIENYEKHKLNIDLTSGNEEGQYSLFTRYNKIFDSDNSPLYVKENAGVVLPKGVDISEAEKNIEYYDEKVETDEGTAIGRITYTYDGKEAGVADILYDSTRMEGTNLNEDISRILDRAEIENKEEPTPVVDNNAGEVKEQEEADPAEKTEAESKAEDEKKEEGSGSFLDNLKSMGVIIVIVVVLVLAMIGLLIYRYIVKTRLQKKRYGNSWKYYNKKNKNWYKRY